MAAGTSPLVDVDRVTGEYISGWPRCEQSIKTILTTRLKTRVERLWWGSDFIDTMDKPMVQQVFAQSMLLAFRYINLYEPEYKIQSVSLTPSSDGSCVAIVNGIYRPDQSNKTVSLSLYRVKPLTAGQPV